MDNAALLQTCLQVTGSFEGGVPSYEALVGNADGMGISVGILQWNAGSGTLQRLVNSIAANMGWDKAKSFFKSDIQQFASLSSTAAIQFAKQHYLDDTNPAHLAPAALAAWRAFLATPESVAAQQAYAQSTTLDSAQHLAGVYVPQAADHNRVIAFFFDLVNQEGSMKTVPPVASSDAAAALAFARAQDSACADLWTAAAGDPLATLLLYYGFERAKLGRAQYVWDSFSRRGTIAARKGIVHRTHIDLTKILD